MWQRRAPPRLTLSPNPPELAPQLLPCSRRGGISGRPILLGLASIRPGAAPRSSTILRFLLRHRFLRLPLPFLGVFPESPSTISFMTALAVYSMLPDTYDISASAGSRPPRRGPAGVVRQAPLTSSRCQTQQAPSCFASTAHYPQKRPLYPHGKNQR